MTYLQTLKTLKEIKENELKSLNNVLHCVRVETLKEEINYIEDKINELEKEEQKQLINSLYGAKNIILTNNSETEHNLTIQQVMQKENVGKYYKTEDEDMILWLSEDNDGYLELLVVDDDYSSEEDLYYEIQDDIYLQFIVNSKYKEVDYKC